MTGKIDSPKILSLLDIDIRVPARVLRNNADKFLRVTGCRTNYGLAVPILTMSTYSNLMYYLIEFGQSRLVFRHSIRRIWLNEFNDISEKATFYPS